MQCISHMSNRYNILNQRVTWGAVKKMIVIILMNVN